MTDDTAHVSLRRIISLEMADAFVCGWREMVMAELEWMRREMPYADTVELTLICERRADG